MPRQSQLERLRETDPFVQRLREKGKIFQIRDLKGYRWDLNIEYGERHPSRGDVYRAALIEFKGVRGVVQISFGPVSIGGKIDSEGNITVTGAGGHSVTIGKVSGAGGCDTSASCSGSVAVPLGGAGEIAVDPSTDTITLFLGPSLTVGPAGGKAGVEGEATISRETWKDRLADALQYLLGDVPPPPPDPHDPSTWD